MPNWTTPAAPGHNIVRRSFWKAQIIDNERALNDIINHPNGGHRGLTDGAVVMGSGQGAIFTTNTTVKGHMIVGDGVTSPQIVTPGTNDTVLRGDSSQTAGVKWEAPNWDVAEALVYG